MMRIRGSTSSSLPITIKKTTDDDSSWPSNEKKDATRGRRGVAVTRMLVMGAGLVVVLINQYWFAVDHHKSAIEKSHSRDALQQQTERQPTSTTTMSRPQPLTFYRDNPFQIIPRWKGTVKANMSINHESLFLGVQTDCKFYSTFRCAKPPDQQESSSIAFAYPPLKDDHFFEWSDLIASLVYAANRDNSFTMVELGAGWGKWIVDGAAIANALGVSRVTALGVEAQPDHCELAHQHIRTNDSPAKIICAAVVGSHSKAQIEFPMTKKGAASAGKGNFGLGVQYLLDGKTSDRVETVPTLSLCEILKKTVEMSKSTVVDFVSLDVQSYEHMILDDDGIDCLGKYGVLMVHISLHRVEANDARPITERFLQHNWRLTRYLPLFSKKVPTSVGLLDIVDGRLSFCNPASATGSFCVDQYDQRNVYTAGPFTQHEFRAKSPYPDWSHPGDTIQNLVSKHSSEP